jgi:acyl-CoA reductase-like NAD-dependent aldehyde dehydrogenase
MASLRHGVEEPAEIIYESVGPIFSVQPWSVPFWQVLRFFITTALVGNTALIKHAESVDIFIPQLIELKRAGTLSVRKPDKVLQPRSNQSSCARQ